MRQLQVSGQAGTEQYKPWKRKLWRGVVIAGLLFMVINGAMWIVYRGRVLPNYSLGSVAVGDASYAQLSSRISANQLLPATVTFSNGTQTQKATPVDLSVQADVSASIQALKKNRPWLPGWSLVRHHTVPIVLSINDKRFESAALPVVKAFSKPAVPNHVVFTAQTFSVAPATNGVAVASDALKHTLQNALAVGQHIIPVPTQIAKAPPDKDLSTEVARLQKQLNTVVNFVYAGKNHNMQKHDLGAWYVPNGQTMVLSTDRIKQQVEHIAQGMGVTLQNADEAAAAGTYALTKQSPLNFRLVSDKNAPTYRYCVAERGLSDSVLPELRLKLAATYGDTRGWNDNGRIAFVYGTGNCNLTVWLVAPAQMASFGAICDGYYSCTVSPNVAVNYDRWQHATDPWNKAGLGIEEYRAMAINHESGHWLGFPHTTCPGAGQPAPVMMQESINLGGCVFSAWPNQPELDTVTANLQQHNPVSASTTE